MGKQTSLTSFFGRKRPECGAEEKSKEGEDVQKRARCGENGGPRHADPRVVAFWNANGLAVRLKVERDRNELCEFVKRVQPDVLCISEVRIPASPMNSGRIGHAGDKALVDRWLMSPHMRGYHAWFSLATNRYAGTCMLVRRESIWPEMVKFCMNGEGHEPEGRVIIAKFKSFVLMHTYAPNNGWDEEHFVRRRKWDSSVKDTAARLAQEGLGFMWIGDLNVAPDDEDLSHAEWFTTRCSDKVPLPPAAGDRGQPGCTMNERLRFKEILDAGNLVDAYRELHPVHTEQQDVALPIFTWRGTPGKLRPDIGKYFRKGMRIDHAIVSRSLLGRVERAEIVGKGAFRYGFMGSDHSPVVVTLCADADNEAAGAMQSSTHQATGLT
mmetsp:Transcript_3665/g.10958  ORF Transcript_3665/g.10958 Transcript_3665/m.10958 type:complete len:382 (+) Transcript_3665:155-1300(+)